MLFSSTLDANEIRNDIPPRAFEYRDILIEEIDRLFPELPEYNFIPALIEHESCISLTHSRCWSSTSQLKTSREQGLGFFQLTRAWRDDGTLRFDTVADLRRQYVNELKEASWDTLRDRPDIQIRAGILLIRQNYRSFASIEDTEARLHMTDAAHNAGAGNIQKERRACGMAKGCDQGLWIDNTENYCLRSKKVLYAGRSACDITKHHVRDVFFTRLPRYKKYYIVKQPEQAETPVEPTFPEPKPPVEDKQPEEVVSPIPPHENEPKSSKPGPILSFFKKLFGRA